MKILLAEDGELNQKLVRRMLEKMGHGCDIAGDGQSAILALEKNRYDAVLMDGQMPVMDGYEAARRIRELERAGSAEEHIPIIALTGGAAREDIDACLAAGMDDHIAKPISFGILAETLRKYSGEKQEIQSAARENLENPAPAGVDSLLRTGENMRNEIINGIVSGLNLPHAIARKLLNQYLGTLPNDVGLLKENIVRGDFLAAAKVAHSIKGASGNLRITKIFQLAGELEQVLKAAQEGSHDRANALFNELDWLTKELV